MNLAFDVPDSKKIRVIVNSDAKNEADDQYAVVHALLTPQFIVKGLIGAHFGESRSQSSMLDSVKEIELLLELMGMSGHYSVLRGAERARVRPEDLLRRFEEVRRREQLDGNVAEMLKRNYV